MVKTDAITAMASKISSRTAAPAPIEQIVAGGVQFELPQTWGKLGATAASGDTQRRIGTVVSALCPGGGAGSTCTDRSPITFIAYSGRNGHVLPVLSTFEEELDSKLKREFRGFHKGAAAMRPGADGIRYLDYPFSWGGTGPSASHQRFAVFRHANGSGLVAIASGDKVMDHSRVISSFLSTAHEPVDAHAAE